MRWILLAAALPVAGCDDDSSCRVRARGGDLVQAARLSALGADGAPRARVEAGGRLVLDAMTEGCVGGSSTCTVYATTECALELDGQQLTIRYAIEECMQTGADRACSADCRIDPVQCRSAPLAPGEYALVNGEQRYAFVVGDDAPPLDAAPFR